MSKSKATVSASDQIELWTPPNLAPYYADAATVARDTLDSASDWFAQVESSESMAHLTVAIAAAAGTSVPGQVPQPDYAVHYESEPTTEQDGAAKSIAVARIEPANASQEILAQRAEFEADRRALAEVRTHARAIVEDIADDVPRAWEYAIHLTALSIARGAERVVIRDAENERLRLEMYQCPVCGESDTSVIGVIDTRPLLPGAVFSAGWFDAPVSLRSCLACWNVASTEHVRALAEAAVPTGANRASVVAATVAALAR